MLHVYWSLQGSVSLHIQVVNCKLNVWLNRYSWGAGKQGSGYVSWFRRLECISRKFLTMSRLLNSLYHLRSCRNSSDYSKTSGNFLPPLMIRLVPKFVWEIFNIIASDARFRIFNLALWCCCIRGILIEGGGPLVALWWPPNTQNFKKQKTRVTSPYNDGVQCNFLCKSDLKWRQEIARR